MKNKILVGIAMVGLTVGTFFSYSTSKMIMCGDRIMQNYPPGYLGITMSNKNWLLVILLAVIGGCVVYLGIRGYRRVNRSRED